LFEVSLILASSSPIRRQMLEAAGVPHEADSPELHEAELKAGVTDPVEMVLKLARAKSELVSKRRPSDWVIGSDSVISIAGKIFSKPADRNEAAHHLRLFSGTVMHLSSAVALAHNGAADWVHVESASLHVRPLSEEFIQSYLDEEWPDVAYCVGVFRLEGRGVQLFQWIEGGHFTILGMPLIALLGALRERDLIIA
jgi:septum formation protein